MSKAATKIEVLQLTPTSWSEFPHVDDIRPVDDNDYLILNEIRDVLVKHKAVERFGVNLIHRHFDIANNEVLFESTNEETRTQQVDVRPITDIADRKNVLETQWVFHGQRARICIGACHYNKGHKHYHSKG